MQQGKMFYQASTQDGDLNVLEGVHDQETQLAVKGITAPDYLKGGVGGEAFNAGDGVDFLEGIPVGAEAVIIDHTQTLDQGSFMGTIKPRSISL
jgi:hypothetical protein